MEKESYSKAEIVQFTLNILGGITIPVELSEVIGVPVCKAIGNLKVLEKALELEETAKEIAKEAPENGRNIDAE